MIFSKIRFLPYLKFVIVICAAGLSPHLNAAKNLSTRTPGQCVENWLTKIFFGGPPSEEFRFAPETGYKAMPNYAKWPAGVREKTENSRVDWLGEGSFGTVYRVTPAQKEAAPWILKISPQAGDDFVKLKLLQLECPGRRGCGFRIPNTEYLGAIPYREEVQKALRSEDVLGRNLYSLMTDPKVSPALKAKLKDKYFQNVSTFQRALEKRGTQLLPAKPWFFHAHHRGLPEAEVPMDGLPMVRLIYDRSVDLKILADKGIPTPVVPAEASEGLTVLIKSDNIIVNPDTLDMTLVDPL